jgi:uncharacterized protein YciI
MSTFVFRLQARRPTFALDMTDEEREIMGRHAAYWQPLIDSGQMVVFGPIVDGTGSWGLGVVEAEDEDELRAFAAKDPVVATRTATIEIPPSNSNTWIVARDGALKVADTVDPLLVR